MLSHIIYNNGIKGDGKKPPRLIPSVRTLKNEHSYKT
jgi:hypothetical protein